MKMTGAYLTDLDCEIIRVKACSYLINCAFDDFRLSLIELCNDLSFLMKPLVDLWGHSMKNYGLTNTKETCYNCRYGAIGFLSWLCTLDDFYVPRSYCCRRWEEKVV